MTHHDALVEALAALAHEMWSGWTAWMMQKWDEAHDSGEPFQARWRRQMATPYAELPEPEKESDRREARRILAVIDRMAEEATPSPLEPEEDLYALALATSEIMDRSAEGR